MRYLYTKEIRIQYHECMEVCKVSKDKGKAVDPQRNRLGVDEPVLICSAQPGATAVLVTIYKYY